MTIRSASSVPQRPFSRDFVLCRQTPGSASNIRFIIKLQKPVDPHIILSLKKEKHFVLNRQFLPKNPQSLPLNLSGFSPRLSTIVIARHSSPQLRVSAVSVCLRSPGPLGLFMVRAGPSPRGSVIVWALPLSGL